MGIGHETLELGVDTVDTYDRNERHEHMTKGVKTRLIGEALHAVLGSCQQCWIDLHLPKS